MKEFFNELVQSLIDLFRLLGTMIVLWFKKTKKIKTIFYLV